MMIEKKKASNILTCLEAAKELRISERKMRDIVKSGMIRASRVGRQIRITAEAVQEFLRKTEIA